MHLRIYNDGLLKAWPMLANSIGIISQPILDVIQYCDRPRWYESLCVWLKDLSSMMKFGFSNWNSNWESEKTVFVFDLLN